MVNTEYNVLFFPAARKPSSLSDCTNEDDDDDVDDDSMDKTSGSSSSSSVHDVDGKRSLLRSLPVAVGFLDGSQLNAVTCPSKPTSTLQECEIEFGLLPVSGVTTTTTTNNNNNNK